MINIPKKKESYFGKLLLKLKDTHFIKRQNLRTTEDSYDLKLKINHNLYFRMKVFFDKVIVVKIILVSVSHLFDLMKDSLILVEISRSQQGGVLHLFMKQSKPYVGWVCILIKMSSKQVCNVLFSDFLSIIAFYHCPIGTWLSALSKSRTKSNIK